ncbi:MAG: flagellar basal body rod protein FlgB [candidate division FCPU426 bacterium]
MINKLVSNELMDLVQKSMDASALQHKVLSNNLANVDTPGFKRSEVIFGEKLKQAVEGRSRSSAELDVAKTDDRHMGIGLERKSLGEIQPEVLTENNSSLRNDRNNVDIDVEMSKLAQNTVLFNTLAQITQQQFSQLKSAIREGR